MPRLAIFLLVFVLGGLSPIAAAAPEAPDSPAQTWTTLMSQGFEGTWPSAGWSVKGLGDVGPSYWGKASYQKHAGTYSVWPAAAGPGAITPGAGIVYPDNLSSQMIYGPFDLSAAKTAELHFWLTAEIEVGWDDYLYVGTSATGTNDYFAEGRWDGSLDWNEVVVDLTKYAGDSSVWVRWDFLSDTPSAWAARTSTTSRS